MHQNLTGEVVESYQVTTQGIPFMVGALKTISKNFFALEILDIIRSVQMAVVPGTVHILKKAV